MAIHLLGLHQQGNKNTCEKYWVSGEVRVLLFHMSTLSQPTETVFFPLSWMIDSNSVPNYARGSVLASEPN